MRSSTAPQVVVAFDLWDTATEQIVTRYASSHAMQETISAERVQFQPVLLYPVTIGTAISGFTYSGPVNVNADLGSIRFALVQTDGKDTYSWLDLQWQGRQFRVYVGEAGGAFGAMTMVYTGSISNIAHDTLTATVTVTSRYLEFDRALVERTYGEVFNQDTPEMAGARVTAILSDTVTFSAGDLTPLGIFAGHVHIWTEGLNPEALGVPLTVVSATSTTIQYDQIVNTDSAIWSFSQQVSDAATGRPKMRVYGECGGVEPQLIDEATWTYHVSTREVEVTRLTVDGIEWTFVPFPAALIPGQWTYSGIRGEIYLGGTPLNGQVRCDVRSVDYATMTTSKFVQTVVEDLDGTIDTGSFSFLDTFVPHLIGFRAKEPVNCLQVLDEAMIGIFGFWYVNSDGDVVIEVLATPSDGDTALTLTELNVDTLRLQQRLDEAYKLQVEYARNWDPQSQFATAVSEDEQAELAKTGLLTGLWEDQSIKERNPRAVEVPPIRSLVQHYDAAFEIRQRAINVLGLPHALYEVEARDEAPPLYRGVRIDYRMVGPLQTRAHAVQQSIGDNRKTTLICWG